MTFEVVSDRPVTRLARARPSGSGPRTDASAAVGPAPNPFFAFARSGTAARLVLAVVIGLAAGALTEWSVLHLSFSLEPLSNTAAPWVIVALAVALAGRRTGESVVLPVVTLIALVLGFYVAEATRGWGVSRHQVVFWFVAGVVVGPLVGLAAGWLRHAGRTAGAVGAGVIGGLLAGEAVYGLRELKITTAAGYWDVQLVVGVGLAVGLTLWRSRRDLLGSVPALAASLAAFAVVGLGTLAVYQVT